MTQYIKKVKFSGILKDFEDKPRTEYAKGKPTRAFITDVLSEDGKIKKSFYWLEKQLADRHVGSRVNFEGKPRAELKYNMTVGE